MSEFTHNVEHVEQGTDRLLERFKNQPNMVGTLQVILRRMQRIEDVIWELYEGVWLDNAIGVQLDNLGDIVGELRKGRQDEVYRLWIRARIKINRSNGKISDTLELARLILESTASIKYIPEYPAAYKVTVNNTAVGAVDVSALLNQVRPAGVQLTVTVTASLANAFVLNTLTPLTNGFGHGLLSSGV